MPIVRAAHFSVTTSDSEKHFAKCEKIGFYPIVDSFDWVKKLMSWGVKSIQLRIKDQSAPYREQIQQAIQYCSNTETKLFINDHWELAIKSGAFGVHLGQEDLNDCDLNALQKRGLRLGISSHSFSELERALALNPTYIALGPIFQTFSKTMPFNPQGLLRLNQWRELVSCQLIAIGGITLSHLPEILACGVDGVSVISAITKANKPEDICLQFIQTIQRFLDIKHKCD